jgi:hypothetical protein
LRRSWVEPGIKFIDLESNTDTYKVMIKTWGATEAYVIQNRVVPGGHAGCPMASGRT